MQITILLENDHGGLKRNSAKVIPLDQFDPPAGWVAMALDRLADMLDDAVKNHRMAAIIAKPGVAVINNEEFVQMATKVKLSDIQPYLKQDLAPGPASEG